jgi:DNA-nicking Smr family endonuclease
MTSDGGRRGKRLSSDDVAVWESVARSVRPLKKRPRRAESPQGDAETTKKAAPKRAVAKPSLPARPPQEKAPPPVAALDRKTKQKIARGRQAIDARVDLHGHSQGQAHEVLLRFLRATQAKGGRVVLVITGKGGRGEGVLKRAVPMWLGLPEFRELVIGFDSAAIGHGGEGALYVRLRKARA